VRVFPLDYGRGKTHFTIIGKQATSAMRLYLKRLELCFDLRICLDSNKRIPFHETGDSRILGTILLQESLIFHGPHSNAIRWRLQPESLTEQTNN